MPLDASSQKCHIILALTFHWPKWITSACVTSVREQNAISSCAPKQETQKFWWADVYHKKGTSYFEGKNLVFRDTRNLGKITLLFDILECKTLNLYYFPLWCFVWHIFTIALISMLHTEQTYFLLKLM